MSLQSESRAGMEPSLHTRIIEGGQSTELYVTATPGESGDLKSHARQLFERIRDELNQAGARILCERLFATCDAMPTIEAARKDIYGDLDDGVPPTRLVVEPGPGGPFAGVQVHAIAGSALPEKMHCCDLAEGTAARILRRGDDRWVFINSLSIGGDVSEAEQARRMFYCAGCFLRQAGTTMKSVARTWLWLNDVCAWYDDLNEQRENFFEAEGLIDHENRIRQLPASTGIGIDNADESVCTMDMIAIPGREDEIRFIEAGGNQRSAYEYGSTFSRASIAPMPAAETLFISGTAAIDASGETEHIGQTEGQIDNTLAHVRSLLNQHDCDDRHVLTALVYCKDAEVERVFRQRCPDLAWPHLTMIGEVCRPDLLFEVEVTASRNFVTR